jgi:hypothetical protein
VSTDQKIATIRRSPSLGEYQFYAITLAVGDRVVGQSIARADEIDLWRKDLVAAGWTLAEPERHGVYVSGDLRAPCCENCHHVIAVITAEITVADLDQLAETHECKEVAHV